MRFFNDFPEAINELRRELKEMSIRIKTKSVQNKDIQNAEDMYTLELQNYQYLVTQPDYRKIPLKNPEWCELEFQERTGGVSMNPGEAWKLREKYWSQFLNSRAQFDYAYPERMNGVVENEKSQLERVIHALQKDLYTRRAFLSIIRGSDPQDQFSVRFPCTLGYWFYYRQNRLNMTYLLRSSDFGEHFNNDIYLANRLQHHIAEKIGVTPGTFSHWIGSFHVFAKDVESVF